jgi:hypothetical protein
MPSVRAWPRPSAARRRRCSACRPASSPA